MKVELHDQVTGTEDRLKFILTGREAPDHVADIMKWLRQNRLTLHLACADADLSHLDLHEKASDTEHRALIAAGEVVQAEAYKKENPNVVLRDEEPVVVLGSDLLHSEQLLNQWGLCAGDGMLSALTVMVLVRNGLRQAVGGKRTIP